MEIDVATAVRADHGEVRGLVAEAFHGIGKEGVEVHVLATRSPDRFSGKAWPAPPRGRKVRQGTLYLVELVMPARPSSDGYPFEWRYPKLKTAPTIVVDDWRERLFSLAAHEAYHVKQFRRGMRRSEVTAERWALKSLERMRSQDPGQDPVPVGP